MDQTPSDATVATYLLQRLAELGAEHLFAVPGDYVAAFLDAVDDTKLLNRVGTANELEAGYAADGYARYRHIAAMAVTYGVGAFSALNAVAGSYVERLPVVMINGSPSHSNRRLGRDRGILFHHATGDFSSNVEVFRHVTVAAEVIESGIEAPEQIDRTLCAAITQHRPVYIEVLKDIWTASCPPPSGLIEAVTPTSNAGALAEAASAAWELLAKSQKGVFWAGVELHRLRLESLLEDLLNASGWPYATTLLAKSLLAEDPPRFAGVYAGPASTPATRAAVEGADVIVALGTLITDDYLDLLAIAYDAMIVAFGGQVRVGSRNFPDVTLEDFSRALLGRFLEIKPRARPRLRRVPPAKLSRSTIHFEDLFALLEGFLDSSMILVVDESDSMYVSASTPIRSQGGYVSQAAWGAIGYATAGAIGVGLGSGKRPVVVIGDGGFQMTCQSLSALKLAVPGAIVLVVDNAIYGIEQALVDLSPFPPDGTGSIRSYNNIPGWDYAKLAQAMHGTGYRAETVPELHAALEKVKPRKKDLSVISVKIPKLDLPDPIRRLAADTGYPRYPLPEQEAEIRLATMQARVNRIKRSKRR